MRLHCRVSTLCYHISTFSNIKIARDTELKRKTDILAHPVYRAGLKT